MTENPRLPPLRVGTCVILQRGPFILMGRRKGSHAAGVWCFPGGTVDENETIEDGARRELREEIGWDSTGFPIRRVYFKEDYFPVEGKRYVTLYFRITSWDIPLTFETMEPEKNEGWSWIHYQKLPEPLFPGILEIPKSLLVDLNVA